MLEWTANKTPIHQGFADKYYAEEGGFAEAQYVYVGQNQLPQKFRTSAQTTVAELGFGTGLNFLATLKEFRRSRNSPRQILHYISFEIDPLSPQDIEFALSPWPEIQPELQELLSEYAPRIQRPDGSYTQRPPHRGIHRLNFRGGVFLTLIIGDATQELKRLQFSADAWYLDGFAPRHNPQLWSVEVFREVARLSTNTATFSTFTVSGTVRRNLSEAGFRVEKFKGFGRKKEMLKGQLHRIGNAQTPSEISRPPTHPSRVLIVGGGLAGAWTSFELGLRQIETLVVEAGPGLGSGASGNPFGMYYPLLTKNPSPMTEFSIAGYEYLLRHLHGALNPELKSLSKMQTFGILQFKRADKDFQRFERALEWLNAPSLMMKHVSAEEASSLAGLPIAESAVYFSEAGMLSPRDSLEALMKSNSKAQTLFNLEVSSQNLIWSAIDRQWILSAAGKKYSADAVIFCNAYNLSSLGFAPKTSSGKIRGQICQFKPNDMSQKLRTIIAGDFYLSPALEGGHILGATYDRDLLEPTVQERDTEDLRLRPKRVFAGLQFAREDLVSARAAIRCTSPTKLPIITKLAEAPGPAYTNIGHGSRGIVYAPLSAQLLADRIAGHPVSASIEIQSILEGQ